MTPIRAFCLICIILCIASVGVCTATPAKHGPFEMAQFREHITDVMRGREMDALALYPIPSGHAKTPTQGFPLVVLDHCFLIRGNLYRSYDEKIAPHGFVVVLPTHTMSFLDLDHSALALDMHCILDHYLALATSPASDFYGFLNEAMIGACGHSLGGKVALLEAADDSRIKAIAALDLIDGGGPAVEDPILYLNVAPEFMTEIAAPPFVIGAELGSIAYVLAPCAPSSENYQRFYEAANPPAIEVTQLGAGYGQCVDPGAEAMLTACAPGTADAEWSRASSAAYVTAFFLGQLHGDSAALHWFDERLSQAKAAA